MGKIISEIGTNGEQPFAIQIIDFASNMASPGHLTMPRSSGLQFCSMDAIQIMQNGAMKSSFVKKGFFWKPLTVIESYAVSVISML